MGAAQSINHSLIYLSGRPTMPRFELIVITWDNPYMLRKRPLRHSYAHTNILECFAIWRGKEYCKIVIQKVCIYIQHIRKTIGHIKRNRVLILFIHQDRCRYNINLFCKLSSSQRLSMSVIPQIVTGQITGRLFLKRYRNMEQKPALVKLTQRCVIENTIAKPIKPPTNYFLLERNRNYARKCTRYYDIQRM